MMKNSEIDFSSLAEDKMMTRQECREFLKSQFHEPQQDYALNQEIEEWKSFAIELEKP